MKTILRFLSSVKLAIVLIIILIVASILGTLIPQGRDAADYAARYGRLAEPLVKLRFTELYRSFWFLGLLCLFGLNITVCTLTRLGGKLRRARRPKVESEPKALSAGKVCGKVRLKVGAAEAANAAAAALRAERYKVRTAGEKDEENDKAGGRMHLLGRKGVAGLFGSDFVHLGLLVIIAGGIMTAVGGFRTDLGLNVGTVLEVPRAGFSLRLDKFETETYPDGSVKDWKSTLTVAEGGKDVRTAIVEVNHPLVHRGYSFYQSAYGLDWDTPNLMLWIEKKSAPGTGRTLKIRVGERAALEAEEGAGRTGTEKAEEGADKGAGEGLTAADGVDTGEGEIEWTARRFLPDFVINESGVPETRSGQPNNPAALVEGWKSGRKVVEGWVFAAYPDVARLKGEAGGDWRIELRDFDAPEYSVIQAAKDPGVPLIWIGCALVMIGLFLAFYRPTWEIRMVVEPAGAAGGGTGGRADGGKTEITAGGTAAKSRDRFEAEFARVLARLKSV